jgi:hypothetical protein
MVTTEAPPEGPSSFHRRSVKQDKATEFMELMFQMQLDIGKGDAENRNMELELNDSNSLKASN